MVFNIVRRSGPPYETVFNRLICSKRMPEAWWHCVEEVFPVLRSFPTCSFSSVLHPVNVEPFPRGGANNRVLILCSFTLPELGLIIVFVGMGDWWVGRNWNDVFPATVPDVHFFSSSKKNNEKHTNDVENVVIYRMVTPYFIIV